MPRRALYLLLAAVVVQWGLAFVGIRILVEHASAVTVALLRFVIASAALAALMASSRERYPRVERRDRGKVLLMAVLGVSVYHLFLNYGEHFVSAGVASLIVASMPVTAALLSGAVLKERIGGAKAAGIGLALAGVAVLVLGGTGADLEVRSLGGALAVAMAPLSFAVYTVIAKPLVPRYGALGLTAATMILGTALLAPFALWTALGDLPRLSAADWGWLAFLGVGCSAFAYWVWFRALQVLDASSVAAWVYLVSPVSLLWAPHPRRAVDPAGRGGRGHGPGRGHPHRARRPSSHRPGPAEPGRRLIVRRRFAWHPIRRSMTGAREG